MIDALRIAKERIESNVELFRELWSRLPQIPDSKRLILVTGHRRENLCGGLAAVCHAVNRLARRPDVDVVWPVHPNPNVLAIVRGELSHLRNVHLIGPQSYLSFVALMMRSSVIITDSGGIQEEAPTLRKPVLVTRDQTERPEAISVGAARLVGTDVDGICEATVELLDDPETCEKMGRIKNPFGDGFAADRIVASILERHGGVV